MNVPQRLIYVGFMIGLLLYYPTAYGQGNFSSGQNSLLLYDHFTEETLDSNRWPFFYCGYQCGYSIANGVLSLYAGISDGPGALLYSNTFSMTLEAQWILDMKVRNSYTFYAGSKWGLTKQYSEGFWGFEYADGVFLAGNDPIAVEDPYDWHNFSMNYRTQKIDYYVDGVLRQSSFGNFPHQDIRVVLSVSPFYGFEVDYVSLWALEEGQAIQSVYLPLLLNNYTQWQEIFKDDFDTTPNPNQWIDIFGGANFYHYFYDWRMLLIAKTPSQGLLTILNNDQLIRDNSKRYAVEVKAKGDTNPYKYGLVLFYQGSPSQPEFYTFRIQPQAQSWEWRRFENDHWSETVSGVNPIISKTQVNLLRGEFSNTFVDLFVNGIKVYTHTFASPVQIAHTKVGVNAYAGETVPSEIGFDDFAVFQSP